ncbi:MAG: hypothetical protein U0167_16675 [bacterium]
MNRESTLPAGYEMGLAFRCVADAFALIRQPFALLLVALVAAGKLLVVAQFAIYPGGPLGHGLAPLLRVLGDDAGPHYPDAYACFPRALSILDPGLDLVLGVPWIVGLIAAMPEVVAGRPRPRGLRAMTAARLPAALAAALPAALLLVGVALLGERIGAKTFGVVRLGLGVVTAMASLAVTSAVAYAVPACALGAKSPAAALARSFALAARVPRLTIGTVLVEAVVTAIFRPPPDLVSGTFDVLDPGYVLVVLGLGAIVLACVEALRVATLARLYIHAGEGTTE